MQCIRKGRQMGDLVPAEHCDAAKTPLTLKSGDSPFVLKVRKPH